MSRWHDKYHQELEGVLHRKGSRQQRYTSDKIDLVSYHFLKDGYM